MVLHKKTPFKANKNLKSEIYDKNFELLLVKKKNLSYENVNSKQYVDFDSSFEEILDFAAEIEDRKTLSPAEFPGEKGRNQSEIVKLNQLTATKEEDVMVVEEARCRLRTASSLLPSHLILLVGANTGKAT